MGFQHVAIAGATGGNSSGLGKLILDTLLEKKAAGAIASLRVLGRKPANDAKKAEVHAIVSRGIPFHEVDYTDMDSMASALSGCDVLLSTVGGPAIPDLEINLMRAAKKAGVRRVMPSQYTADLDALGDQVNAYHIKKVEVANALRTDPELQGLEFTLIVTGIFLEVVFSPIAGWLVRKPPSSEADEVWVVDPPSYRLTGTARPDIAKFVAEIVSDKDTDRTKNVAVRCIASQWTYEDAIKAFEATTGRKIQVRKMTLDEANKDARFEFRYGNGVLSNFATLFAEEYYNVPEPWNGTDFYGAAVKPMSMQDMAAKVFGS
ncbi:hypothetical protein DFJ74DRAFT_652291 [Hyaloraphidium curvatum]|nr:hypothetical protein DFJ74DRAFT_652291 [Hyaloraphidium curvatum]